MLTSLQHYLKVIDCMVVTDVAITRERQLNEEQSKREQPREEKILLNPMAEIKYSSMIDSKIRQDAKVLVSKRTDL